MFANLLLKTDRPIPNYHNPGIHQWKGGFRQQSQRRRSFHRQRVLGRLKPTSPLPGVPYTNTRIPTENGTLVFPKNSWAHSKPDKNKSRIVTEPDCPRFGQPNLRSTHSSKNTESCRKSSSRAWLREGASSDPRRLREYMSLWVIALANEQWVMSLGHFTRGNSPRLPKKQNYARRPHQRQDTSFTS